VDPVEQGGIAHVGLLSLDSAEDSADHLLLLRQTGQEGVAVIHYCVELTTVESGFARWLLTVEMLQGDLSCVVEDERRLGYGIVTN
jgi:hypothetical protein